MGRGRAKAKQTKVARDLKYRTHETDFGELARELHGSEGTESPAETSGDTRREPADATADAPGTDDYDKWADYSEPSRRD